MTAGRILLLATGGTIGSIASAEGLVPAEGSGRALGDEFDHDAVVVAELFAQPSGGIGMDRMAVIRQRIVEAADDGFAGVVVTHGTDTLADTAFVVRLLHGGSRFPVVFTGAMRSPGLLGTDARRNLHDAVLVARSDRDFGTGVVIVFDGQIYSALRTQKLSSTSTAAFAQPGGGPLGYVVEDRVVVQARESFGGLSMALDAGKARPVALIGVLPGDDGSTLLACARRVDGVVVAGLGGGHVPPQMMDAIGTVAVQKPLIVTSGTFAGAALRETYGGPGSERSLSAAGAICGWSLGPRKAALALSLCLGQGADRDGINTTLANDMEGDAQ